MALPIVTQRQAAPQRPESFPTVAALDALWQRFEATPLSLPARLWRKLMLRRSLDVRQLDAAQVRVVAPTGKRNDCGGCTDMCCIGTRNTVLLRLRDIATLVDVGRTELIVQQKPSFDAALLQARPALRRHAGSRAWQIFPVLAQNSFGACMALSDAGKCGLYPHWPLSCARFPYALDVAAAEVFYSQRCRSFGIHPDNQPEVQTMAAAAVAGYNERIKDALLLRFCAESLAAIGLVRYLNA